MKKKVLFVLEAFDKGGIEKVTLDIINNLDKDKYDITVKVIWFGGHCQSLVKEHIKVEPFFKKYIKGIMRFFIYAPKEIVYKTYIKEKYDVEIAAGDGIPSRIVAGSANKNSKKISWIHMDVQERGSKLKEFNDIKKARKIYSSFDDIICVSKSCKKSFEEKFGLNNLKVVYNPINNVEIKRLANEELDYLQIIPKDIMNFIAVGRIEEQKGFDKLVRVHKRLIEENLMHRIILLGDGSKKVEIEDFIKKNKLENTFKILGFRSNPYKYIKNADIFILSSRDEAYPTVLIESVIIGTPIIATNCCGVEEILEEGSLGMIIGHKKNEIYEGMKSLIVQKEQYYEYQKKIKLGSEKFNFKKDLELFEKVFLDI
ncbi:MAG: glycosyltransferase [Sarcina sp.]